MSGEIATLEDGVRISSFATFDGKFRLQVFGKVQTPENEIPSSEYGVMLKKIWTEFIENAKQPELLGYKIPPSELATETLHYIRRSGVDELSPITPEREELMYWFRCKFNDISNCAEKNDVRWKSSWELMNLETTIMRSIQAKQKLSKDKLYTAFL